MKIKSDSVYEIEVLVSPYNSNSLVIEDNDGDLVVLSKEIAAKLLPILEHFVKTGELPE